MHLDAGWIALISTMFGGVALNVVNYFLNKSKVRQDFAGQLRDELRLEVSSLREENKTLEAEYERWREAYYNLKEEFLSKQNELNVEIDRIKRESLGG